MKKKIAVLSTCLLLTGILSACGTQNTDSSSQAPASNTQTGTTNTQTATSSSQTATSTQPHEIKLDMKEFSYSMPEIKVHAGEKIHFVLTNSGKVEHDINSEELKLDKDVAPGKTETLDWTAPSKPGTYPIICDKPGHKEQGMTFNLVVEK
ncbi:cupredoxin domain-containing protein [Brevibacillus ginsengisoli]|uniref:cupredoxin domain-containing protein n=1 Tax=Brevibacillus ginsengisoli TaxID=363854 RepID=UPI003CF56102